MVFNKIQQCSHYFNYGYVDDSIIADSFLWDEDEFVNSCVVTKHVGSIYNYSYIYFFTSRHCLYPMSFKDKTWGLWENLKRDTGLEGLQQQEYLLQLNRYAVYVGVAQVHENQISLVMKLLKQNFMDSFVLFSNRDMNLSFNVLELLEILEANYSVNFSKAINGFCDYATLVTCIQGSNGTSMNCFYSVKN